MLESMRNLLVAILVITALEIGVAGIHAQETSPPDAAKSAPVEAPRPISDEDIQLLRKDIRAQRKQLIATNLPLTPSEAEKFWPVYDQYVSELVSNNNKK